MKKLKLILLTIAAVLFIIPTSFAQKNADDILGVWMNEDKDAHVKITLDGDTFNGVIVWIKDPIDEETGKPKLDDENEDD